MLTLYHAETENPHAQPQAVEAVVTTTPLAQFSKLIEGIEKMVKELQDQQEVLQFKNHRSENS